MFGEQIIGALISGGMNLYGGMQAQEQNAQTNFANMMYNANQAEATRVYNAQQAQMGREFSAGQMSKTFDYNTIEAEKARQYNTLAAETGRVFNRDEAQKARDWTEQMSSTAYQRAVQDMKAAGINPMLAYMKGGADTGSAAAASGGFASGPAASSGGSGGSPTASSGGSSLSMQPIAQNVLGHAYSSALETMKSLPVIKRTNEEVRRTMHEADRTFHDAERAKESVETQRADTILRDKQGITEEGRSRQALADARLKEAMAQIEEHRETKERIDRDVYAGKAGAWARHLGTLGEEAGRMVNSADKLGRMMPRSSRGTKTKTDWTQSGPGGDSRGSSSTFSERFGD